MVSSRCSFTVAALLAVGAASACVSRDDATQITVALATETDVPSELDTVEVVVVDAAGAEIYRNDYAVTSPRFFPTTLAIVPRDKSSLDRPVTIEVRGSKADGTGGQVLRRAVVPFFEGRTLLVPMPLRMACFDLVSCAPNETCAGGRCVPAQLDVSSLVDYREQLVFGALPDAACFDEAACLGPATPLTVAPDCTFALPSSGDPGKVNVSIRWAAAADRVIGLDGDDAVEGWSRISDTTGLLSAGVCDSLLDPESDPGKRRVPDRALDASVSTSCATKVRLQPYCPGTEGRSGMGTPRAH